MNKRSQQTQKVHSYHPGGGGGGWGFPDESYGGDHQFKLEFLEGVHVAQIYYQP